MQKRKINESTVREWYVDYRDMIHTYLVYLTLSDEVDSLVSQAVIQSAKMSTSKRTARIHPYVLILSAARFSVKRQHRRRSPQSLLESLQSQHATSDTLNWMNAVLSLPDKEREVFVLREVLGLDSRQTGQIVKYTSIKVEDRLATACRSLHEQLNNEYTKQLLRKLDSDPDSLYEPMLPVNIRNLLEFYSSADSDGENTIEMSYRKWLTSRRRRRLFVTGSSSAAILLVGGLAALAYKPWIYFLSPSNPSANSVQLRQEYTKSLGFLPRLPASVPKGYKLFATTLQRGDGPDARNQQLYIVSFWTGQNQQPPNRITIIEGGKQVTNFSSNNNGNTTSDTMTMNGVKVHSTTDKQSHLMTAHFKVGGEYYVIINYQNNNNKTPVTEQQMASMIRSMIVHPKVLTQPIDYTYDNLNTMQEIEARLNFTPVILTSLPGNLTTGQNKGHGFVSTHGKQKYGTFSLNYSTPNHLTTVNLIESKGLVTEPTGQQESAVYHPLPGDKNVRILGQKVYVNTQAHRLFWRSNWTGVSFQLNLQSAQTSPNQPDISLKQVAKKLITADKENSAN